MGKHIDLGHVVDPAKRRGPEENPRLALSAQQTSLTFDLLVAPNHKGHIVPPGDYRLDILIAAENSAPVRETVEISLRGQWFPAEEQMLRDGVGVRLVQR